MRQNWYFLMSLCLMPVLPGKDIQLLILSAHKKTLPKQGF
jgi:hypothetical protein